MCALETDYKDLNENQTIQRQTLVNKLLYELDYVVVANIMFLRYTLKYTKLDSNLKL